MESNCSFKLFKRSFSSIQPSGGNSRADVLVVSLCGPSEGHSWNISHANAVRDIRFANRCCGGVVDDDDDGNSKNDKNWSGGVGLFVVEVVVVVVFTWDIRVIKS